MFKNCWGKPGPVSPRRGGKTIFSTPETARQVNDFLSYEAPTPGATHPPMGAVGKPSLDFFYSRNLRAPLNAARQEPCVEAAGLKNQPETFLPHTVPPPGPHCRGQIDG